MVGYHYILYGAYACKIVILKSGNPREKKHLKQRENSPMSENCAARSMTSSGRYLPSYFVLGDILKHVVGPVLRQGSASFGRPTP